MMIPPKDDDAPELDVIEIADDADALDEHQPLDGATCARHLIPTRPQSFPAILRAMRLG